MRHLLVIPSYLKSEAAPDHPRMDYYALRDGLRAAGAEVDLLSYDSLDSQGTDVKRFAGQDAALAWLAFRSRKRYSGIFTNGENLAIPLALLLGTAGGPVRHVTIGHRLSTGKKQPFFRHLRLHRRMDTILVYATTQAQVAREQLRIPPDRLRLIAFHADTEFYRPLPEIPEDPDQVCSAGLEWRDYPTLIEAVRDLPELKVRLAAASPWSKHANETEKRELPPHVQARRYSYAELRELYARSAVVVVPLYENDFQAGVTTLLEAMAMGKPVIVTRTTGQTDVVVDGENGLTVPPGDAEALRAALQRLRSDSELRRRLGENARRWVEQNATLELWVQRVTDALRGNASSAAAPDERRHLAGPVLNQTR